MPDTRHPAERDGDEYPLRDSAGSDAVGPVSIDEGLNAPRRVGGSPRGPRKTATGRRSTTSAAVSGVCAAAGWRVPRSATSAQQASLIGGNS